MVSGTPRQSRTCWTGNSAQALETQEFKAMTFVGLVGMTLWGLGMAAMSLDKDGAANIFLALGAGLLIFVH